MLIDHDSIYFPVALRQSGWLDKHGAWHVDEDHQHVIRQHPTEPDKAVQLGVVGAKYNLVHNKPLFEGFESELHKRFASSDISVRTERAYLGARVGRTYRINATRRAVAKVGDVVAFNVFARNSYSGEARFRVGWSVENLVCTNQLVTATDKELYVRRHTSGLTIEGILRKLNEFVDRYQQQTAQIDQWGNVEVKRESAEELLAAFPGSTTHWQQQMFRHAVHGAEWPMSFWRFLNVLTFWSTHGTVRNTREDNTQAVRWDRQNKVRQWLLTEPVKKLIAA